MGQDREFLLAVREDDESESLWARVRLGEKWSVAGRSPSGIVGPARPWTGGLLTMSLSGDVVVVGTTYEEYMSVLAVPRPYRVEVMRRYAGYLLAEGRVTGMEALNLRAWLDRE